MKRNRAFTIIEVIIASLVLFYVSGAFYSLYTITSRDAVHSEFLALADIAADSLLEEVEGHRYGLPAPKSWGLDKSGAGEWQTFEYDVWSSGRKVEVIFHAQWHLSNGSFIGAVEGNQDVVTIVVSWSEGEGEDQSYGEFSNVYFEGDNRHIVVQVPVWK